MGVGVSKLDLKKKAFHVSSLTTASSTEGVRRLYNIELKKLRGSSG